ncbi:MAG: DHH family phosphoesterase [Candidatus Helarchaeota archaeon]|nr:DHH family phosphoesterase [Candidatus Helarchaeota archaeon]
MEQIPVGFLDRAYQLAARLQKWKRDRPILIVGHRDGDGISAASVLYQGLKALNFKKITTKILLSPDIEKMQEILSENLYDYVITGDIGAEFEEIFKEMLVDFIIADHHPNESSVYGKHQLNSCEFHMNDESDCSGSTTTAMILVNVFPQEFWTTEVGKVILCYAIAGAVSDFQMSNGPTSVNKYIADLAVNVGAISMRKDICFFGRGMYPVFIALNRSGIPSLQDINICRALVNDLFELKEGEQWRRIIDLTDEEKKKLVEVLTIHLLSDANLDINTTHIINGVINYVYDLEGLEGWDCTLLSDGRRTYDPREILHRINYVSRRGKADLALELLNNKFVDENLWDAIESYHRIGDREVAQALELYKSGKVPMESWDERIVMVDFSNIIYYDEVGVVAGVLMKKFQQIEIMLSYCEIEEENIVKLSIRANDAVWNFIEKDTQTLADAKQVYHAIRKKYPSKVMQYGGHRWACSGYLKRDIVLEFFREMLKYYKQLRDPSKPEPVKKEPVKSKINIKTGQWKLDQYL